VADAHELGGHEQLLGEAAIEVVAEGLAADAAVLAADQAEAALAAGDDGADDDAVAFLDRAV
jgi:hypothetical protein